MVFLARSQEVRKTKGGTKGYSVSDILKGLNQTDDFDNEQS